MQAIHACSAIGLGALNPPASVVQTQHNDSLLRPASACQKLLKSEQLFCRCAGNSCFSSIVPTAVVHMPSRLKQRLVLQPKKNMSYNLTSNLTLYGT